ncbi:salutaridinol 7-o-acetyltransferase [Phtheirospermum japonicum]|uniref:Salutaridinol 7-o-acetyltransferase n=1 Tax=Phtheirospermum japonicum TaxID=374723 RepID=A0A830BMZ5_9LAMI|nr:salutaridinol 7-o-acetyltransferase [Phtheirospermum japonicum]
MVFYYPNLDNTLLQSPNSISETTQLLKQSLSSTLTRFYPLAGRIRDDLSIDCNDEGVLFIVTKFQKNLSTFLKNPNPNADLGHVPAKYLSWTELDRDNIAVVQVNHYECGGIVLGSLVYHRVADGISMAAFMKDWAATARGEAHPGPGPSFDFQSLFPHDPAMQRDSHLFTVMRRYFKMGRLALRRYVFDAAAISALRAQLAGQDRPTRVEIVSAVMWKFFMAACAAVNKDGEPTASMISHALNLRRKAEPQFPENSFGNLAWIWPATSPNEEPDRDVTKLLVKVRGALRKVDSGFVKRMEGEDGVSGYRKNVEGTWGEFTEKADYLAISSWCNFGLYGVDFGWGRPVWVTKCDSEIDMEFPLMNVMCLMDTREGDGVEVRLNLDEKYAAVLDEIEELRHLAKFEPSPLDMVAGRVDVN